MPRVLSAPPRDFNTFCNVDVQRLGPGLGHSNIQASSFKMSVIIVDCDMMSRIRLDSRHVDASGARDWEIEHRMEP